MKKNCVICDAEFEGHYARKFCDVCVSNGNKKEWDKLKRAEWKKNNPEKVREQRKAWEKNNPEKVREMKRRRNTNPDVKAKKAAYMKEYNKEYNKRPEVKKYMKEYRKEYMKRPGVREKQYKYIYKYITEKRKTDQAFALRTRFSNLLNIHLKEAKVTKSDTCFNLMGYTIDELKKHLESQFTDGMSWENRSEWHIDHIRPVSSFNFTTTDCEDFKKCWALNNLQPLWAKDNMSKGDKWDGEVNA